MRLAAAAVASVGVMGVMGWGMEAAADTGRGLPTDGEVAFSYSRDPAVKGCAQQDEAGVRDLIEGVMHTEPFVPAGKAGAFEVAVRVTMEKAGVVRAVFELRDGAGVPRGSSKVEDVSCDDVHLKLAASIGLLLEPRKAAAVVAAPACAECDAGCRAAIKEGMRGEVKEELREEVGGAVRREVLAECEEKYRRRVDVHAVISLGAIVGFNYAADPAPGFWLAGEARGSWWSAGVEARGVLPTRAYTLLNGLGTVDFATFSGILSPCLRWKWLSGCALVEVGTSIHRIPGSFDSGATYAFLGLGLRGRVDIPITAGVEARVFGDAMAHPLYVNPQLTDPTGPGGKQNPVVVGYEAPRVIGAFVGLGIAKAFE